MADEHRIDGQGKGLPGDAVGEIRQALIDGDLRTKLQDIKNHYGLDTEEVTEAVGLASQSLGASTEGAEGILHKHGMDKRVYVNSDKTKLDKELEESDEAAKSVAERNRQSAAVGEANAAAAQEYAERRIAEEEEAKAKGPYIEMSAEEEAAMTAEAQERQSRVSDQDRQAYQQRRAARRAARQQRIEEQEQEAGGNPMLNPNAQGDLDDRVRQAPGHETADVIQASDAGVQHQVIQNHEGDVSATKDIVTADELPGLSEGDKIQAGEIGESLAAEGTRGGKSVNPRDAAKATAPSTPARAGGKPQSAGASV